MKQPVGSVMGVSGRGKACLRGSDVYGCVYACVREKETGRDHSETLGLFICASECA